MFASLSLGLGLSMSAGAPFAFTNAGAEALVARMTSEPNDARKAEIETLYAAIEAILAKLDAFYVFAAHDSQAALLNWCEDSSASLAGTTNPSFAADRGFTGNAAQLAHIDTGISGTRVGNSFARLAHSAFVWCRTNGSGVLYDFGQTAAATIFINPIRSGTARIASLTAEQTQAVATGVGFTAIDRADDTGFVVYKDGASQATKAVATLSAQNAANFTFLRYGAVYSSREVAAGGFGGHLTAQEHSDLYAAVSAYMTAVGA